jgi:hypothetical protein
MRFAPLALLWTCLAGISPAFTENPSDPILAKSDIAQVWAGHPVGFALFTQDDRQFVAFYDAERRMTVGVRRLDETDWKFAILPERLGWDSHNSVTLDIDSEGYLHLSGNMHVAPLVYYRTTRPLDIESFESVPHMTGELEEKVTYPSFFHGPVGELIFTYRDGKSGSGNQIYNVYEASSRTWKRLLDKPLTDGEGHRNAYLEGPVRGPDGTYHLLWVWRESPDCATNHDLSYARSRDLHHWETSGGTPLALPITLATGEVVDPVPSGGGLINGNAHIGFDNQGEVVLSYQKYDPEGNTQVYSARLEEGKWIIRQTSHWDWRWAFSGGGAIPVEIGFSPVQLTKKGELSQTYTHAKYGRGTWILDKATFEPIAQLPHLQEYPDSLMEPESDLPGMQVNLAKDLGTRVDPGVRYVLRWETLGPNRDRPREGEPPPPSMLRVCKVSVGE